MPVNAKSCLGTHDFVFITFDTLRFDVADALFCEKRTPQLEKLIGSNGWEKRHSPGNFTYAAHQAFFAGFLPTPARPGKHPRLWATTFIGSETITPNTLEFETANIVEGFASNGYRTICIGGVGFFNKQTALSNVFPSMFAESYWRPEFSVTSKTSTQQQFQLAAELLGENNVPSFLFINISAMHQPNHFYLEGAIEDSLESQSAALQYVDSQLPILMAALSRRERPSCCVFCADHGTTFGEDGYSGHRLAHPKVWEVPYAEFVFPASTLRN